MTMVTEARDHKMTTVFHIHTLVTIFMTTGNINDQVAKSIRRGHTRGALLTTTGSTNDHISNQDWRATHRSMILNEDRSVGWSLGIMRRSQQVTVSTASHVLHRHGSPFKDAESCPDIQGKNYDSRHTRCVYRASRPKPSPEQEATLKHARRDERRDLQPRSWAVLPQFFHRIRLPKNAISEASKVATAPPSTPVEGPDRMTQDVSMSKYGREKISAWNKTAGSSKEWRRAPYVRVTRELVDILSPSRPIRLPVIGRRPGIMQIPINAQRRHGSVERTSWFCKERFRSRTAFYFAGFVPEDALSIDVGAMYEGDWSGSEEIAIAAITDPSLVRDEVPGRDEIRSVLTRKPLKLNGYVPDECTVPPENFIGSVLGSSFRVLRFVRSEVQGNVYAVEALSGGPIEYEAKAFVLRHISTKEYQYRIRNLKRMSNRASFVCSFDQYGKKFVINRKFESHPDVNAAALKEVRELVRCQLGGIGRRGTLELKKAFPKLAGLSEETSNSSG